MSVRTLTSGITAWRIGDPAGGFPIYSAEGARQVEGRWHSIGQEVIYASEHYGTALLEKLVHFNGNLPSNQHFIEIDIPAGVTYEVVTKEKLPGWDSANGAVSREFGEQWLSDTRTAILIVPSVVSREENNILINPNHADANKIRPGLEKPVRWDDRLFS